MNADERANILLVDDRPQNLLALSAILEPLGHNLVEARSGEEALKALLKEEFALVLLDVQMPELDGFETAALIKQRERTRHVPIIFLTALSRDARQISRGYSGGAVDYIVKPFDPDLLRSKVSVFVELHQKRAQLQVQA
jgi:CheY-like chemotaxis protein